MEVTQEVWSQADIHTLPLAGEVAGVRAGGAASGGGEAGGGALVGVSRVTADGAYGVYFITAISTGLHQVPVGSVRVITLAIVVR